ncbi:MAG: 6-bladed beta-propeller [bacterium]|nr:6-bladed beta-propeller [bacterium]
MYNQLLFVLTILWVLQGCVQKRSDPLGESLPYIVDIEECLEKEHTVLLSELVDTIEYLELKTPKDLIITTIRGVKPVEGFLLVDSRLVLYKFTNDGQYVTTIGKQGQGPGEYTSMIDFDVDYEKREIIVSDCRNLYHYDYDGKYLYMNKGTGFCYFAFQDSLIWACNHASTPLQPNRYAVMNRNGDTLRTYANPIYGILGVEEGLRSYTSTRQTRFYRYDGKLYTKGQMDEDTVYQVYGAERIPYLVCNMGSLRLPNKYAAWYDWEAFQKYGMDYWQVAAVFEDDRYVYLTVQRARWDDDGDDFRYVLYDKVTREGFVQKKHAQQKIKDDILGCIDFWPRFESEDYFYDKIEWYDLQNMLKEGHYAIKPELQQQFDTFDYGTNELIIRCKKQKQVK